MLLAPSFTTFMFFFLMFYGEGPYLKLNAHGVFGHVFLPLYV